MVACVDRQLPPSSEDVADYLAFLSERADTEGSAADARGAIGFIATVNAGRGWNRSDILGGRAALPLEALRRRHAHAVSKAPGLPASFVRQILERYVVVRSNLPWDLQWRLAVGVAIGTAFKLMARYADMRFVRYDNDKFLVFDTHVRVYISERKTHVYGGQWIDVAKLLPVAGGVLPSNPSRWRDTSVESSVGWVLVCRPRHSHPPVPKY